VRVLCVWQLLLGRRAWGRCLLSTAEQARHVRERWDPTTTSSLAAASSPAATTWRRDRGPSTARTPAVLTDRRTNATAAVAAARGQASTGHVLAALTDTATTTMTSFTRLHLSALRWGHSSHGTTSSLTCRTSPLLPSPRSAVTLKPTHEVSL